MKLKVILFGLLLPFVAWGQIRDYGALLATAKRQHVLCPDHSVYLVRQDFEAVTNYDNCETWTPTTASGAVINPQYTGIVLAGTQSLLIACTNNSGELRSFVFTAQDEVFLYCMFRPVIVPASSFKPIFLINQTSGGNFGHVALNSSGTLRIALNTVANTVDAMSANTTYHVFARYKKGTGANAIISVGFSTDGTRPTSGNKFAQITTGNTTLQCGKIALDLDSSVVSQTFIFDKVRVATTQIPDNPP